MSRAFSILPDAQHEITEAADWYHALSPRLGAAFRRAVRAVLGRIRTRPLRFALVYKNARAAFLVAYPYRVPCTAEDIETIVVACTHHRRDPRVWMERLG